jgi:hypothetical protein
MKVFIIELQQEMVCIFSINFSNVKRIFLFNIDNSNGVTSSPRGRL